MDGLRAAAALAVVMIHVSAGQTTDAELVWNQLSRFAVPMFLVLTGFGHAGALAEGKFEPEGRTAVRRRLSRVLPAYFLWSAAYLVLEALCGTPHAHPLFDLLTGGAYVHLYYIFILVQFVLLADFFCIAMQRHPRRLMLCAAAATFGMQLLIACQANGMLMFHAPLSLVRLFFGWTLFYTGGIWLRLHEKWQRCPLCVSVPVWLLSALGVLLICSPRSAHPRCAPTFWSTSLRRGSCCGRCAAGAGRFRRPCALSPGIPSACTSLIPWCCACGTSGRPITTLSFTCACRRCICWGSAAASLWRCCCPSCLSVRCSAALTGKNDPEQEIYKWQKRKMMNRKYIKSIPR